MTDPEREHLLQRVEQLERRLRRWRLAFLGLFVFCALPIVVGGLLAVVWQPNGTSLRV